MKCKDCINCVITERAMHCTKAKTTVYAVGDYNLGRALPACLYEPISAEVKTIKPAKKNAKKAVANGEKE